MQDFTHQGYPGSQLAGQPDAGNEAQQGIGFNGRDHPVGKVGQRVQKYRAEHDLQAPFAVAHNTPEDAPQQHARHLHVQQKHALVNQLLPGKTDGLEARYPDDAEQHQIVDIDKVAEGRHDDRQAENTGVCGLVSGCGGCVHRVSPATIE